MRSRFLGLVALAVVLALPFALRPREQLVGGGGESLVILTPHNEAIRYEFARAFHAHMRAKTGREVRIDWRTPGGTNEIARFVSSEYAASFERYWTTKLGKAWTGAIAARFANPAPRENAPDDDTDGARRAFLDSDVGIGIDLLFGGGSPASESYAASGYLVDSGFIESHPEIGDAIPAGAGGTRFRDPKGRWVGTCLSGFGICFNRDSLERIGIRSPPERWSDLADPRYLGRLALADPSKSGSAAISYEMVIQEQMGLRAFELRGETKELAPHTGPEKRALHEGWDRAMRLIRRFGANARYFSDAAPKIALDIASGDAAAGMCIDFYGRSQSEAVPPGRMGFSMPRGGTAVTADPIGLLRGAPHRELALDFIDFALSVEGQKLWDFKVGAPGGPERHALRRLPIRPELYAAAYDSLRSDPGERAYEQAGSFVYRPDWTAPLLRAIAFIVRVMCIDTQEDLAAAYRAIAEAGFPPGATALFDDVGSVDYLAANGRIRATLASRNPIDEVELANELTKALRAQYRRVVDLCRSER